VCTSCHGAHEILPHTDPASSINRNNVSHTCQKCHTRIEEVHRKVIRGRLWEEEPHKVPVCVDCHSPHKIRNVFYPQGMANKDCLTCHEKPDLTMERDGATVSLYVDEHDYLVSSHGSVACAQCHTEVSPSRVRACETIKSKVDCSICHAEVVTEYDESIHGQLAMEGDPDAPSCLDCHEKHATLRHTQPHSPTFSRNIPDLCARCHRAGEKAAVRIKADVPDIVKAYEMSIHGKGLFESGLVVTANCADCHGAHKILPPADPASSVNRHNVADTCGKCHHGIEEQFRTSIHWPEGKDDGKKRPTCEDCHSSHSISRVDRADFRLNIMNQCGRCHEEEAETFFDTYHGKVSRLGSARAAKCHDCHGTHNILPPTDPRSTLSRANVVQTCGKCHQGAHRQFAGYLTHATHHDRKKYPYLFWAFWGMTSLLVGTLAFASVHTGAWLWRSSRAIPYRRQAQAATARVYRRFSAFQRLLHLGMLLSFFTLALTGMSLKFSYMPWAVEVSQILGGFDTMGFLHRTAALALIAVFVVHLNDLRQQKKAAGMGWVAYITRSDSLLFNLNDLKELWGSIKWFVGAGPRPRYGRFSYWEKFDYFAVFWGVAIIGSTGLVLWFPEFFTHLLPGWSVNVATIIHSDEALLAVAFIFTVHFFNTHFRPGKFPMDPVIFTGQVTMEELEEDKPREYDAVVQSGREDNFVEAVSARRERVFKAFGFTALAIGLTLIGLIIYTMLFGYR
jgi:cytochrome b subunit of formate dehydrogenase